jgi:hypothetical protein
MIMNFHDLLRRADLQVLQNFILHGADSFEEASDRTFAERLEEAERAIDALFAARIAGKQEREELMERFYELAWEYQAVYFSMGLLAGAKLGRQLCAKAGELL